MRYRRGIGGHASTRLIAAISVVAAIGCEEAPPPAPPLAEGPQVLDRITRPADSGEVHLVRLVQRGDRYAFEPAEVTLPPGDVVRFVMVGSQPESVAFDPAEASLESAAYIRGNSLDSGVLLTDPGQAYDVSFRDAPLGRYPFLSVPHAGNGMRGAVVVAE